MFVSYIFNSRDVSYAHVYMIWQINIQCNMKCYMFDMSTEITFWLHVDAFQWLTTHSFCRNYIIEHFKVYFPLQSLECKRRHIHEIPSWTRTRYKYYSQSQLK